MQTPVSGHSENFNKQYYRIFKQYTGISPKDYTPKINLAENNIYPSLI